MGEAHTAHMGEVKNMWKIFVTKPEGRETWCRWKDNGSKRKRMWSGFSHLKIKFQAWTPVNSSMKLPRSIKGKSDNSLFTDGLSNDTVSNSGYIRGEVKK